MLERKKAEGRKRRRKKDIDLINDNDDAIAKMIADMRLAAREDRDLNIARLVDFLSPMGSHHHQAAILVPDDKLDGFGHLENFFAWSKMV